MAERNSFAGELITLQNDIADDVGGILKVVKEQKLPKSKPASPPESSDVASSNAPNGEIERRQRRASHRPKHDESAIMENVTTRLSRETNERLTEAALRQKLKKLEPDTRQGIIEAAVREWLKREHYLVVKEESF